jgi:hypothetical protein
LGYGLIAALVVLLAASSGARADFPEFAACLGGPGVPADPGCLAAYDADGDGDVDLLDLAVYQADYVPPVPTGACCFDNLSCQLLTEADCLAAGGGGEWLGVGSDCSQCVTVRIQRVTYGGSGNQTVTLDCSYPPCFSYSTPQWLDDNHDGDVLDPNDRSYPVAYTRNTSVALSSVRFHVQPGGTIASVPVRGFGPDGLGFSGTGSLSGNWLTVAGTLTSSTTLPNTVRYYSGFEIDWEVALDGVHYYPGGTSSNRLYATYATALGDCLESYYFISTPTANGLSAEQDVIDAVWAEFADRVVFNAHGQRLAYYRGVLCASECSYYSGSELVYYTTSQCGGWADLMIQCLRTQGIGSALFITIEPRGYPTIPLDCGSYPSSASGFIVNNYTFNLGSMTPCANYPYSFNDPCGYYGPWPTPSCLDATGLPGQDNPNPASWFARHFIVKINLRYYDPSYGAGPFTGTHDQANLAWEIGAIAGYFGIAQSSPTRSGVRKDQTLLRETNFSE